VPRLFCPVISVCRVSLVVLACKDASLGSKLYLVRVLVLVAATCIHAGRVCLTTVPTIPGSRPQCLFRQFRRGVFPLWVPRVRLLFWQSASRGARVSAARCLRCRSWLAGLLLSCGAADRSVWRWLRAFIIITGVLGYHDTRWHAVQRAPPIWM